MLERVLEPEIMDSAREACDCDRMDHGEVNRRFVEDLLAHDPSTSEVLDVGTGTARIPIELCVRLDTARVMGIDLSIGMLDMARNNVEVSGLIDRVMLDRVDAKQMPFEDGRFLTVMSNSMVHHIPNPIEVLSECVRVTTTGGLIFVRDLLRPRSESDVQHLVDTYAGDEIDRACEMFYDSLCAALDLAEIQSIVLQLKFDADTVKQTSDRHWTWCATVT